MNNILRENTHEISTEIFRNNQCCKILAGFDTGRCIIRFCEDPVKIIIFFEGVQNLIAQIQVHIDQLTVIAFIQTGNGNLQIACIAVRIPACSNIKPCIKSRNNSNTHDNDHGDNI